MHCHTPRCRVAAAANHATSMNDADHDGGVIMPCHLAVIAQVQSLPKAALLLASAPDSTARDTMLQFLPVWAPGSGE